MVEGREIVEYEDQGCCLNCSQSYPGCLCFECQCTACDEYNPKGYCELADEWRSEHLNQMDRNLQVTFTTNEYGHTLIKAQTIGPVDKVKYAKVKPFLLGHFRYNHEEKCYQVYSENWRFIRLMRQTFKNAGFTPNEKTVDLSGRTLEVATQ